MDKLAGFSIKENWTAQTSNSKGLADLYNLEYADLVELEDARRRVIATSFFLPHDVLESSYDLKVSQISVFTQDDFMDFWLSVLADETIHTHADVDRLLLVLAKHVGVSARWYCGKLFVVCKVWYGNPPAQAKLGSPKMLGNYRLQKLLQFCGLVPISK
jgi:hypothetical protein